MTVARDTNRRGAARIAPDPTWSAAAAQARSEDIQRQLNLSASERAHFELVCEVKPDWNDTEIVAFLQKCNYNTNTINDALMNAFEDLRPSEDQSAADWSVQSKKSKRKPKEKVDSAPGDHFGNRRRSGPRDRSERNENRDRVESSDRPDRSERRERQGRPSFDRRPKRDFSKPEGAASKPQPQWASSSGNWGEAQSTLPVETPTAGGTWVESPAESGACAEPLTPSEPKPELTAASEPVSETLSPKPEFMEGVSSTATTKAGDKQKPLPNSISWAGITKLSLSKPVSSPAPTVMPEAPITPAAVAEFETKTPAPSNWGADEVVGQWGVPEPALAENTVVDAHETASVAAQPERAPTPTPVEPPVIVPSPRSATSDTSSPTPPSADALLAASEPVILPQFVSQQAASSNSTLIQFGSFSIADDPEIVSPNAECVRIHSAQADISQQMIPEDVTADLRARHDYETAIPMHQFYPPFLNNMHSYMPYEADTAYFEPYNQQQRVQRPRQQSYNNARNNKMRRDHRNASGNQRQPQPEEFPVQPMSPTDQSASAFTQGVVPARDFQGAKQAGAERPATGGSRGNKQRQLDRRGGVSGAYHHPSYAGGHIPVGYGQPYAYPAPYLPQFYGQNQQGYGPPGFRQHYSQYQNASNYQQPYQPRSAYMGQTEYVDTAGMHIGQGEPGPVSKQSDAEHVGPDQSVLYPFEHQAWPDQQRYVLQQQQPQANESSATEPAAEGTSIQQHSSFDPRGDASPSQQSSFGYGSQQYPHSYQNFSNQLQYSDNSNRSYPHWASHQ